MKPQSYLSKEGKVIFDKIAAHLVEIGISEDINSYELSMLANSFDLYAKAAKEVTDNGYQQFNERSHTHTMTPSYNIMKIEYSNIIKHAPKFGINPVDIQKVMKDDSRAPDDKLDSILKTA